MRRMNRKTAAALSLLLSLSGAAQSFAGTWNGMVFPTETLSMTDAASVILINNKEDFQTFANSCYTQEYSAGIVFSLQTDLDLTDAAVMPVPLFCGIFEGNGHEIRGVELQYSGSDLGLFRYVEEGAVIRNLHVSGNINADAQSEQVGGIAGVNRGTITECSFSGSVTGKQAVGGIVGHNEAGGQIESCQNHAEVTGIKMTGGIAGLQEGSILSCINHGNINTEPDNIVESDDSNEYISLDRDSLRSNLSEEQIQDTGGIAGFSEGTIYGCKNLGMIGSERMGDYVGGIAGRQDSQLVSCENEGKVIGRRYVGGIVGQSEPYLRFLYEEDTLDQLEKSMDMLSGIKDELSKTLDTTSDQTFDHFDEVKRLAKEVRTIVKDHKNDQKEKWDVFRKDADEHLNTLQEVVSDLELNIGSRDARNAMSRISKNTERCRELLNTLGGNTGSLFPEIATFSNSEEAELYQELGANFWIESESEEVGELASAAKNELMQDYAILKELAGCLGKILDDADIVIFKGSSDVEDDVQDIIDDLDSLRTESNELVSLVRSYTDQLLDDLDTLDDDLSPRLDSISDEGDILFDVLKGGKDSLKSEKNQLNDQLDQIDQVLKDGKQRIREHADKLIDKDDLLDDVSDDTWQELSDGMILNCSNIGSVMGESEAGGIAGNLGIKVLEDLKDRVSSDGIRSLNVLKEAKAVISDCKNEGEIQVRYHYAGGIVGNMTLGLVRSCESYGTVESENGNYVGGIAGKSETIIRSSYSMCSASGEEYIGGIAGSAKELHDNVAMASLQTTSFDHFGVIAGWSEDDSDFSGNLYVDEGIGAVNGITYTAQAKGMSYETLLALPELPSRFHQMDVRFFCDGEELKSIRCNYGDALDIAQFPKLPEKEGYYGEWERNGVDRITNNMQIHAVYEPFTVVVSSGEEPLALMLAEGNFYPNTKLTAEAVDTGTRSRHEFRYEIQEENGALYDGNVKLRLLAETYPKHVKVSIRRTDGSVTEVENRWDGKYLVFDAPASADVTIIRKLPIAEVGIAVAAVLGVCWLIYRRRKKKIV